MSFEFHSLRGSRPIKKILANDPTSKMRSGMIRNPASIALAIGANRLREIPHRPVDGQYGLGIRFFWLPLDGLTHYCQPPQACYIELFVPTATKC